jgi:hypothetical protein
MTEEGHIIRVDAIGKRVICYFHSNVGYVHGFPPTPHLEQYNIMRLCQPVSVVRANKISPKESTMA